MLTKEKSEVLTLANQERQQLKVHNQKLQKDIEDLRQTIEKITIEKEDLIKDKEYLRADVKRFTDSRDKLELQVRVPHINVLLG